MGYKRLGTFIKSVSEKNVNGNYTNVLGVSIEKEFMPSVANIIGTDLKKYNILRKNRFAFNPMHVGRDKKLPIAIYHEDEPAIVSPAYNMFEVIDSQIDIRYLMLVFKTNLFDHLCWFHTDGSVRGGLTWNDFCDIEISIPSLEEQRKIIHTYNILKNRINTLNEIQNIIKEQTSLIIQSKIKNKSSKSKFKDIAILYDNIRKPLSGEVRDNMTIKKYPYYGAASLMDYVDNYIFEGTYGLIAEDGSVCNENGHPTLQYVWGKFWVNNHAHIFQGKDKINTELLYFLLMNIDIREYITGAVQLKINQENLNKVEIHIPIESDLGCLNNLAKKTMQLIKLYTEEINGIKLIINKILFDIN